VRTSSTAAPRHEPGPFVETAHGDPRRTHPGRPRAPEAYQCSLYQAPGVRADMADANPTSDASRTCDRHRPLRRTRHVDGSSAGFHEASGHAGVGLGGGQGDFSRCPRALLQRTTFLVGVQGTVTSGCVMRAMRNALD